MRNTSETLEEFADLLRIDRSGVIIPKEGLVDAAVLEIANLFEHSDWLSNFRELLEYEYIEDGRIPLRGLLDELEYRSHAFPVASQAVYRLLNGDHLLGSTKVPSFRDFASDCPDPVLFMRYTTTIDNGAGGELVILPLICPGQSLSQWRNLSPVTRLPLSEYEPMGESRAKVERTSAPAGAYVLEKINNKTIRVYFGEETDSMTGDRAFRVYKLICQGRIHVLELSGRLKALEERGSTVSFEDMAGSDNEGHAAFGTPGRDTVSKEELKLCFDKLNAVKSDIESADSEAEKKELEEEKGQIVQYIREVTRLEPSVISKARGTVDMGFRRTIAAIKDSMPSFAQHFKASKCYDKVNDQYVYRPAQPIPWKFKNFQ